MLYGSRVADDSKLTDEVMSQVKELASKATGIPIANLAVTKFKVVPTVEETPTMNETVQSLLSTYGLPALLLLMLIILVIVALPRKAKKEQLLEPVLAGTEDMIAASKYNFDLKQEHVPEIDTEERSEVKKQLEKFVKQKPDAVAQLLRNWLTDDYE